MSAAYFALFDDADQAQARLLTEHRHSQYLFAHQLHEIDAHLQAGWQQGWHVCLLLPYEFGTALHLPDEPHPAPLSLHWFAQKQSLDAQQLTQWLQQTGGNEPAGLSHLQMREDQTGYLKTIANIQAAIARGDVYQINHTVRLDLTTYGHPAALYQRLRQRQSVPYGFLAHLPENQGARWTLSLSPELFLRILPDGHVETEPMKGTAPRLNDGQDEQRANTLAADPKNRAENIMIVDLLRNDLGKIAQTGGVSVPELFRVRPFGQVWQMTSLVRARLPDATPFAQLLAATFPCGSITGAPKRMSMSKIRQWESSPRGLYTGSIGHLKPHHSGLGYTGCLNVAIRTLTLQAIRNSDCHQGNYGVGSGIVMDSNGQTEYQECGWKSRLISELPPEFGLIESLRAENGHAPLLPHHRLRLSIAAAQLRFPAPDDTLWQNVEHTIAQCQEASIVRIEYRADAPPNISVRPIGSGATPAHVLIADTTLPRHHFLRRFKTTHRAVYDQAWQHAVQHQAFDALFFNEDGHLLEGGRSNVFLRLNHEWHTPSLDLDILDGIMRGQILANPQGHLKTDRIQASHLTRADLHAADEIILANAVRGLIRVKLLA